MLPIALDLSKLQVALVGRGPRAVRRLELLREARPGDLIVYSDDPSPELAAAAPVVRRLPGAVDLFGRRVVYIADLGQDESIRLAERARAAGALVNVEDIPALCDFHSPSVLRRGDLSIAVSTAGTNPSLAKLVVRWLKGKFGPGWDARSGELARHRQRLRDRGLSGPELHAALRDLVAEAGWLEEEHEDVLAAGPAPHAVEPQLRV